jgi:hypothetical protein
LPGSLRALAVIIAVLMAGLVLPQAASAHGEGDSDESLMLVRQAIAFLVNKPGDQMDVKPATSSGMRTTSSAGVSCHR